MQKRIMRFFSLTVFVLLLSALSQASAFAATAQGTSSTGINPYSPAYQHSYRHGVVPTISQNNKMKSYSQMHPAVTGNTLGYGGGIDGIGVTSGHEKVYLIFYGTQWGTQSTDSNGNLTFSNDPKSGAPLLQQMFKGLGTGNELWSGVMTQYCDGSGVATGASSCPSGAAHVGYPTNGALSGVWYDNSAASPSAASGHQLAVEAINAAAHFNNTTAASNRYAQYVVLSPTGANPDNYKTGGFCAWHDYNGDTTLSGGAASSPYGDIAFTNMPYVMDQGTSCGQNFVNPNGTDDGYTMVEGHEYAETITDQNPAGGWTASSGQENADECAWISTGQGASANVTMGNGTYAMQSTWSNDTNRCDISHSIIGGGSGGNDFSISANPSSLSIAPGSNGTSTISTAVTSGSAGTVSLTASVSPSGPTASLSPTSVTAGNSSTLTVSVGSTVASGTYTVTVSGTEGSANHSTSVTVTVGSGGGGSNIITNGGFESGSSSWTQSSTGGYQIVDPSNPHTGSYSAYLCGYNYCTDTIYQTVTIPSTATKVVLSYWTYISTSESGSTCYDYFYARLRTSTGSVISTPQQQCNANTHGWTKYSFDVTSALSSYKGQQVQVYFAGTTDSSLVTNFYVDDVALTVS
ncbi:hypothetical protein [Dictyobacter formicarum]|uniref:MAM domain-containing protein n=1 Tax=Dictyobacter formicarum TaxID=2778368 RepID=A0ABQ3VGQ4_9CHLR|nr:hypothetical protein [Dictyobacter formicarum]GHO84960.1 hypothetical protein KSZ_29660 [Dictyobacter formicarum]